MPRRFDRDRAETAAMVTLRPHFVARTFEFFSTILTTPVPTVPSPAIPRRNSFAMINLASQFPADSRRQRRLRFDSVAVFHSSVHGLSLKKSLMQYRIPTGAAEKHWPGIPSTAFLKAGECDFGNSLISILDATAHGAILSIRQAHRIAAAKIAPVPNGCRSRKMLSRLLQAERI